MASVRLSTDMDNRLKRLCATTKRTKSFYIKEAISRYLEDVVDDYIAADRIARPKRKLLSTKEVLQRIDARK
jgi:RHH-type rel operon transcriptional repressor/antitoxin RelB